MIEMLYPERLKDFREVNDEKLYPFYWFEPYDLWYYFINQPTMRFVNNYYQFEVYSPTVFKHNIDKALNSYCNTQREKCALAMRLHLQELDNMSDTHMQMDTLHNKIFTEYTWVVEDRDCCKKCKQLDGTRLKDIKNVQSHWLCRCKIQEHIKIIDKDGNIVEDTTKLL